MIKLSIDVTKLLKEEFFQGKKGKYVTLVVSENKDGADEYGNTHYVCQEYLNWKEAKELNKPKLYVGNGKEMYFLEKKGASSNSLPPQPDAEEEEEDDIPF